MISSGLIYFGFIMLLMIPMIYFGGKERRFTKNFIRYLEEKHGEKWEEIVGSKKLSKKSLGWCNKKVTKFINSEKDFTDPSVQNFKEVIQKNRKLCQYCGLGMAIVVLALHFLFK